MKVHDKDPEPDTPDDPPTQSSGGDTSTGGDSSITIESEPLNEIHQTGDDELPCGHESIPQDAPDPPFWVQCDVCGGQWKVTAL